MVNRKGLMTSVKVTEAGTSEGKSLVEIGSRAAGTSSSSLSWFSNSPSRLNCAFAEYRIVYP
jgi:hypothetical protein